MLELPRDGKRKIEDHCYLAVGFVRNMGLLSIWCSQSVSTLFLS